MKHFLVMLTAALATLSCGLHEIGGEVNKGNNDVWTGPAGGGGTSGPAMRSRCYVTCLDYPEGYDWRADREKGSVKCSLVVYSDGVPVMKVPVGDDYEVSSDPDMHRIVSGHLITDYATASETVVKMDGLERLRYPAREIMAGVIVKEDDIYTLGQSRSGDGFSLRLNGEVILERASGHVLGSLYEDNNAVCFAFAEKVASAEEDIERYYHVCDGKVEQVGLRDDVQKIWDVMARNGRVFILASLTGIKAPVIICEDGLQAIEMPSSASVRSCRLFPLGEGCGVEGIYSFIGRYQYNAIWIDGTIHKAFDVGHLISSLTMTDKGVSCLVNPLGRLDKGIIFRNGEEFEMPEGYSSIGGCNAAIVDGILYAGLSSMRKNKPVLWKDGAIDTLDVHGFISGLSIEKVRK